MTKVDCHMCGTCCTAYDISSLGKSAGVRCKHLLVDNSCGDYNNRPAVCRSFKADALCVFISTLPMEERVAIVNKIFYSED